MTETEAKQYIEDAFQALKRRGWYKEEELVPSTITEQEVDAFEQRHGFRLPTLYRAYLQSWRRAMPDTTGKDPDTAQLLKDTHGSLWLNGLFQDEDGDYDHLWLELDCPSTMEDVERKIDLLKEIQDVLEEPLPEESFRYLVPIGDWGAGWGPLCLDLSRPEEQADPKDPDTWPLVWFDHEEFDWKARYLGKDGLLHGQTADVPTFRELVEWYFFSPAEEKFETERGIRPTPQWYKDKNKWYER